MAVGLQENSSKFAKKRKHARRKTATPVQESRSEETAALAAHVVGKMAEREPDDNAHLAREEPEAASRNSEGLDAGFARYSESSDFANRGRDRS